MLTGTAVQSVAKAAPGEPGRLRVDAAAGGQPVTRAADLVLVVVGVRPDTALAVAAGASLGTRGAIVVDEMMRTGLPGIYAAGDCVVTLHRILGKPICRWVPPRTSRAGSRGRTRPAATASSQAAWAPRW